MRVKKLYLNYNFNNILRIFGILSLFKKKNNNTEKVKDWLLKV